MITFKLLYLAGLPLLYGRGFYIINYVSVPAAVVKTCLVLLNVTSKRYLADLQGNVKYIHKNGHKDNLDI